MDEAGRSVETQIAVLTEKIDTVIKHHEKKLETHETLHNSAHAKISVVELQVNTHEVRLAAIEQRSMGMFGKVTVTITTVVSAVLGAIGVANIIK